MSDVQQPDQEPQEDRLSINDHELSNLPFGDESIGDESIGDDSLDDIELTAEELESITVNPAGFADLQPKKKSTRSSTNGHPDTANLDMLLDIGLQVTVELGRAQMTIKEVLSLGPGTVVELNRVAGEPVDILINGKAIAKGEVVVLGDMFGVRVTDIIPPAQRVQSMM